MSEAMIAQEKARLQSPDGKDDAAYDYAPDIMKGKPFAELNPEQQARLIEDAYKQKFFDSPNAKFDAKEFPSGKSAGDATTYLNNTLSQIRNEQGAP